VRDVGTGLLSLWRIAVFFEVCGPSATRLYAAALPSAGGFFLIDSRLSRTFFSKALCAFATFTLAAYRLRRQPTKGDHPTNSSRISLINININD
jgi:hypothetical protein